MFSWWTKWEGHGGYDFNSEIDARSYFHICLRPGIGANTIAAHGWCEGGRSRPCSVYTVHDGSAIYVTRPATSLVQAFPLGYPPWEVLGGGGRSWAVLCPYASHSRLDFLLGEPPLEPTGVLGGGGGGPPSWLRPYKSTSRLDFLLGEPPLEPLGVFGGGGGGPPSLLRPCTSHSRLDFLLGEPPREPAGVLGGGGGGPPSLLRPYIAASGAPVRLSNYKVEDISARVLGKIVARTER